jgi:DNA-binding transcriptional LysR family regulator
MLNPRQIEAFRWVMLRGSVTGAAIELGISQPAVSRLVRDLESAVGIALFERHGNHLRPTPEADLLLGEVERYATGMQAISRFAADLQSRRRGTLRVIALPAMAMGYLPRFVARFIEGRPLSNVHLHGMPSHLVIEAVGAGQADIGIAAAPVERAGLRIEPLAARAVLAVPVGHRLAARRRVKAGDLAGERVIVLAEPTIFGSRTGLLLAGVHCETVVTTPLSGIACTLVSCGAGVAIVDPFSAADFRDRGVVALRLEPPVDVRIAIVTAVQRRLPALAQEFVDAFREHVARG